MINYSISHPSRSLSLSLSDRVGLPRQCDHSLRAVHRQLVAVRDTQVYGWRIPYLLPAKRWPLELKNKPTVGGRRDDKKGPGAYLLVSVDAPRWNLRKINSTIERGQLISRRNDGQYRKWKPRQRKTSIQWPWIAECAKRRGVFAPPSPVQQPQWRRLTFYRIFILVRFGRVQFLLLIWARRICSLSTRISRRLQPETFSRWFYEIKWI